MGLTVPNQSFQIDDPAKVSDAVSCQMVGKSGLAITLSTFLAMVKVKGYKGFKKGNVLQDYPPTPKSWESWRVGLVQNVLSQTLEVTWLETATNLEKRDVFPSPNTVMLDASDDAKAAAVLPFFLPSMVVPIDDQGNSILVESFIKVDYGGTGDPPFVDSDLGFGPDEYELNMADQPSFFCFSFHGGGPTGSNDPIVAIRREIRFQLWVVAARTADIQDVSKYFILGFWKPFSVFCSISRRQSPSDLCWFDPVTLGTDIRSQAPVTFVPVNSMAELARAPKPVVAGALSAEPLRTWLKSKKFA